MLKAWSLKYPKCVNCGTIDVPHRARGLCRTCYGRKANKLNRLDRRPYQLLNHFGEIRKKVTREYLIDRYYNKQESLQEIANDLKCSRQYISKLMKSFYIKRRSRRSARAIAMDKGKIVYQREDSLGNVKTIRHERLKIDRSFFENWSDSLAYLLGLIYTDGNLLKAYFDKNRNKMVVDYRISISQKDPYILNQIKDLLSLNISPVKLRNNKNSYIYRLDFRDKEVFEKLESFGLCPNKSLKITFPDIPKEYLSGFIRGLFDGDGSYRGGRARLATGSRALANGLKSSLESVGFRARIYETPKSFSREHPSYTVAMQTKKTELARFYLFLYSTAMIFIPRKRKEFENNLATGYANNSHIGKPTQMVFSLY